MKDEDANVPRRRPRRVALLPKKLKVNLPPHGEFFFACDNVVHGFYEVAFSMQISSYNPGLSSANYM